MKQKRIVLIGYKIGSASLKNLQSQLQQSQSDRKVLRVAKDSTRFKARRSDKIVTWGKVAPCPHEPTDQAIAKEIACNKLHTFEKFKEAGVPHPEWTTDLAVAKAWNKPFLARTILTGHSGEGIVIVNVGDDSPSAPLYVLYKKKKHEYRVHVFNKKVIDVTQKKRKAGFENHNNQIRNHQNGWVYCREDVVLPQGIEQLALDSCAAVGLNSGAVDIIWNELENKCYVLEINTAPGVEGTTCKKYCDEIIASLYHE